MRVVTGDLWGPRLWYVVTTNLSVTRQGRAVLGRGVAKQAVARWPDLPEWLGHLIREGHTGLVCDDRRGLLILPVKRHWAERADLALMDRSLGELADFAHRHLLDTIYMPVPGIGFGGLERAAVDPLLWRHVSALENVVLVERGAEVEARYREALRPGIRADASL